MLSGFGNMAFGLLTGVQLIAVGSMITTLSPLLVVILAHFVLKERLAKKQVAGVLVATVGAMVMVL
jgi:drug/metabolite transporter (DMT)-like permease